MLRATDVSFRYEAGNRRAPEVLSGASVAAGSGSIVGLLGPNGSGKTTLLKILAGMLKARSGRVTLDDRPLESFTRRELARRIAMVPQETHSTFDFSVLDIVLMGRYPHLGTFELEGPQDLAIARAALTATDTLALQGRPFATLSGGEKQRVVIASALAQEAGILLLDEPTSSLDLSYQWEIAALLGRLNRERGTTMVVSTHDLNFAAAVCGEIVMISRGTVVAHGETSKVLTAANIRAVYGMDADVSFHERAGHLTVVPVGRSY
jgi:iron complex transport system ATP-binding protein